MTIGGEPFPHLLYHFWLAFCGWQYVKAICGGESFTALTEGLQEALWQLGGVPRTHRTDRLSAAYRNLRSREDEAAGYAEFCATTAWSRPATMPASATRTARSRPRTAISRPVSREALELRGSRDFADLAAYQAFLAEFVARKNARRRERGRGRAARRCGRCRAHRTTDFSLATVTVTRSGTISVRGVLYTVPSRLVGCRAEGAHLRRPPGLLSRHHRRC